MLGTMKEAFFVLSFSRSLATNCISLNIQQRMTRPTHIDLNPNGHIQGLHHYPFMVSLDR